VRYIGGGWPEQSISEGWRVGVFPADGNAIFDFSALLIKKKASGA
jgi:hypothetical protein